MILPHIDISIENDAWPKEETLLTLVKPALESAGRQACLKWPDDAELSLLFTDDAAMTEINGQWRNNPNPTNVLSFPGADIEIGQESDLMIGDLVFAFETVAREAVEQQKNFEDHLSHLTIHGFLHLFGFDHIKDGEADQMEAIEIAALKTLGINNPYANL